MTIFSRIPDSWEEPPPSGFRPGPAFAVFSTACALFAALHDRVEATGAPRPGRAGRRAPKLRRHQTLAAGLLALAAGLLGPAPARAEPPPTAAELLFNQPHLRALAEGTRLEYRFERRGSDPAMLGENFTDAISLVIDAVAASGTRDVSLRVFTGARQRDIQSLPDLSGNPVLILFLDRATTNMQHLAGGQQRYFKDRFRGALRDAAAVEAIETAFAGKPVSAYKVTVRPFVGDAAAPRMLGYDGATFELVLSDGVPGMILGLRAAYESAVSGAPRLEETVTLEAESSGR